MLASPQGPTAALLQDWHFSWVLLMRFHSQRLAGGCTARAAPGLVPFALWLRCPARCTLGGVLSSRGSSPWRTTVQPSLFRYFGLNDPSSSHTDGGCGTGMDCLSVAAVGVQKVCLALVGAQTFLPWELGTTPWTERFNGRDVAYKHAEAQKWRKSGICTDHRIAGKLSLEVMSGGL